MLLTLLCLIGLELTAAGPGQPPPPGPAPGQVRLLDLTGNGALDKLHLGNDGSLGVSVHIAGRTWQAVVQQLPTVEVAGVLAEDLDADGDIDLYLVSPASNVALRGDGLGYFDEDTSWFGLADPGAGVSAEHVDLDDDGLADVLLHNAGGDVIFWGRADGRYERSGDTPVPLASNDLAAGPGAGVMSGSVPGTGWEDLGFELDAMGAVGPGAWFLYPTTSGATSHPMFAVGGPLGSFELGLSPGGSPGGAQASTFVEPDSTGTGYGSVQHQGSDNNASGDYSTVGGGQASTASGHNTTVGGGQGNTASKAYATVSGGKFNIASGNRAAVGGGSSNTASGIRSTVAGGFLNKALGHYAAMGGGRENAASTDYATVAGGMANGVFGAYASVGGGASNVASGAWSTIAGGQGNEAIGSRATVMGGFRNIAEGNFSFAAGRRAEARHRGSMVFGDSKSAPKSSTGADTFNVYASGGATIFTNGAATTGVTLAPGAGSWSSLSDRASKENVEPVDGRAVLERLARVPIATWNYKEQDDAVRHMGPMSQDFHAAFGLGVSERLIDTVDPDGVALAAIQGLRAEKDEQLQALRAEKDGEIAELRAGLAELRSLLDRLVRR